MHRPVEVLAAGGTITMAGASGGRVTPSLDAAALVAAIPRLGDVAELSARTVRSLPGPHMGQDDALAVAQAAVAAAEAGHGVVVTHGTDTLEETAFLTDVLYGGQAPIVFTGAIRPASASGADGPANLLDAVDIAGSAAGAGLGVVVVFAGRVHAARGVRKVDSTAAEPFGSPHSGPIGVVHEGRVMIDKFPLRRAPVVATSLDGWVPIVPTWLGDDASLLRAALGTGPDGVVLGTLGAGHVSPAVLAEVRQVARRIPVVATVRPERGAILYETYGYEGSEGDLRDAGVLCAGALSPQAARMKLLACLGAGLSHAETCHAFLPDDA